MPARRHARLPARLSACLPGYLPALCCRPLLQVDVDPSEQDKVAATLLEKFNCVPTFLSQDLRNR